MKAISILQPWAILCAMGLKHFETRSRPTKFRGEIFIHASQSQRMGLPLELHNPFLSQVYNKWAPNAPAFSTLSFGAIIGKVNIIDCIKTEDIRLMKDAGVPIRAHAKNIPRDWNKEMAFGDFSPGRYGYLLSEPVLFKTPISAKGQLCLWSFNELVCLQCGCTENDCRHCIEKTGQPCYWINDRLCSACSK